LFVKWATSETTLEAPMKRLQLLLPVIALTFAACATEPAPAPGVGAGNDGLTLTVATAERLTGSFVDGPNVLTFDTTKVGDDLFLDLRGNGGRPIIHVQTIGDTYEFSYMGGALKMHTTKAFVAQARAQAETQPDAVSTDGFIFEGDTHALDAMLQLPEVAALPYLSRAVGARGFTGNQFPATLVLHKMARQSAEALGIDVEKIETPATQEGYCTSYPNSGDSCYGMCGPGCSCWSWVCGDCCYHYGCAVHDSWCRQGKWYYCYNITAVIALFGC
jgi:hypothetical protein